MSLIRNQSEPVRCTAEIMRTEAEKRIHLGWLAAENSSLPPRNSKTLLLLHFSGFFFLKFTCMKNVIESHLAQF